MYIKLYKILNFLVCRPKWNNLYIYFQNIKILFYAIALFSCIFLQLLKDSMNRNWDGFTFKKDLWRSRDKSKKAGNAGRLSCGISRSRQMKHLNNVSNRWNSSCSSVFLPSTRMREPLYNIGMERSFLTKERKDLQRLKETWCYFIIIFIIFDIFISIYTSYIPVTI